MTDDFGLFDDPPDGGEPVDADVALISAYLGHELSLVQVVAVEDRLAKDVAFRRTAQPILDAWAMLHARSHRSRTVATAAPLLTPADIEAGWMRHVAVERARKANANVAVRAIPSVGTTTIQKRRPSMTRIAATIAVIVLPLVMLAEVVVHAAKYVRTPGHALAQDGDARFTPSERPSVPEMPRGGLGVTPTDNPQPRELAATAPEQHSVLPARSLGPVTASSPAIYRTITSFRALANGRVVVRDGARLSIILLDSSLTRETVILGGAPLNVSAASGIVFPHRGDSTLFLNALPSTSSMPGQHLVVEVLDSNGRVARSTPWPGGLVALDADTKGFPRIDPRGRIIYRGEWAVNTAPADSAPLVATDLASGRTDTLAMLATPRPGGLIFPAVDAWAVLTDGTLAVVRARDYHIDWVHPDGSRSLSQPLPYPSARTTSTDKRRLADSAWQRQDSMARGLVRGWGTMCDASGRVTGYMAPAPSLMGTLTLKAIPGPPTRTTCVTAPVSPDAVPDLLPPFTPEGVMVDAEDRLWIRTSPQRSAERLSYDVVDRSGRLFDRVELPGGRKLLGFGAGGSVYLGSFDGGMVRIERASYRVP